MKAGVENCDIEGNAGPIPSQRAQQLVDDYNVALQEKYPDDWQEQPFDGKIAYDIGGGLPHGCLAIGASAIKKPPIVDAAKENSIRPSTSRSYQNLIRRYEEQVESNKRLTEQNVSMSRQIKRNNRLLELLCQKVQMEITPGMLEVEENRGAKNGSSHASANLENVSDGH